MHGGFQDRSRRLALFGTLAILCGVASTVLGLMHLAVPLAGPLLPGTTPAVDVRSLLMSAGVCVLAGGILIVAGVGSVGRRRWVRSAMLPIGWTWLLSGTVVAVMVWGLADEMILVATAGMEELPPGVGSVVKGMLIGGSLVAGMLLPAALIWAYSDRHVQPTCDALGPPSAWSESRPTPVLGLGLALIGAALLTLPLAIRPAVPFFGTVLAGWPGALAILLTAAVCGWLGRSVLRSERRGWWGTMLFLVVLGLSVIVTLYRVDPAELYRQMGYTDEQVGLLESSDGVVRAVSVWATVLLTAASAAYLAAIRRHFR